MAPITDYKLHRVLARFPWRRRKPRAGKNQSPIGVTFREGQRLWANPSDLAAFEDPGPALVCVAMHSDTTGHGLLRSLVAHHAMERGLDLPPEVPGITQVGLSVLEDLIEEAGLDPEHTVGAHALGELIIATWALAAAWKNDASSAD